MELSKAMAKAKQLIDKVTQARVHTHARARNSVENKFMDW